MRRPAYRYQIKSGAEIIGSVFASASSARATVQEIAMNRRAMGRMHDWVEVERFVEVGLNARRYWVQRGNRWELYRGYVSAEIRKPAWGFPP